MERWERGAGRDSLSGRELAVYYALGRLSASLSRATFGHSGGIANELMDEKMGNGHRRHGR